MPGIKNKNDILTWVASFPANDSQCWLTSCGWQIKRHDNRPRHDAQQGWRHQVGDLLFLCRKGMHEGATKDRPDRYVMGRTVQIAYLTGLPGPKHGHHASGPASRCS